MAEFIFYMILFGIGMLVGGIAIGYFWGHGVGYEKGRKVGNDACETRHLGSWKNPDK